MRRFHPANLRAAWWAFRTARRTRRVLAARGLDAAIAPPPPPPLPPEAERGVRGALYRGGESCLVRSIVLQAWEVAHGRRRDLVVGITGPNGFRAHAWLDGDPLPSVDDAGHDPSVLGVRHIERWAAVSQRSAAPQPRDADAAAARRFQELLRRPASQHPRQRSA